jgi:drug/metabolite transporter (DMT)-like permease
MVRVRCGLEMATRTISLFNVILMLILIVFWGSSFVVVKILELDEGLTPIAIATFRFLIAGGLFLVALFVNKSRERRYRLAVEKKDALALLLLALVGVTFFFTAQYTGIQMAGPSIAAILVCLLSPILIAVLSAKILKERLTRKQILGTAVAATGTFIVITGSTMGLPDNKNFFLGSLILLATPALWATYSLLGKKILEKYNPFLVVSYVNLLGGLCLTPFSLAENSFHQIFTLSLKGWIAILFLSVTCSLIGYYIWFYVINRVGPTVTSSFLFAEPLVTVSFAFVFVGEKISLFIPLGGLLIFTGVYLVTMK